MKHVKMNPIKRRPTMEVLETRTLLACDFPHVEFETYLTGLGQERGSANFEVECEHGESKVEFSVELQDAVPGSIHPISVTGVPVGSVQVDQLGRGILKLSNESDDPDSSPLPAAFPTVSAGSSVTVGSILTGALGSDRADDHDDLDDSNGRGDDQNDDDRNDDGPNHDLFDDNSSDGRSADDVDHNQLDDSSSDDSSNDDGPDHDVLDDSRSDDRSGDGADDNQLDDNSSDDSSNDDGPDHDVLDDNSSDGRSDDDGPDHDLLDDSRSDVSASLNVVLDSVVGDVNFDGVFNVRDVVTVLQAGEYEDGIKGNSSWITGDWDGNHDFDRYDLVFALQQGRFDI